MAAILGARWCGRVPWRRSLYTYAPEGALSAPAPDGPAHRRLTRGSGSDLAVFARHGVAPDPATANIPPSILHKVGRDLHNQQNHPLQIAKRLVVDSVRRRYVHCVRLRRPMSGWPLARGRPC
jgi:hypothetical protein